MYSDGDELVVFSRLLCYAVRWMGNGGVDLQCGQSEIG